MKPYLMLLFFLPVFSFAQRDSLRWSIGASIGFEYTDRIASSNNALVDIAYYDSLEKGVLQWNANLMLKRKINQQWSVSSGLYWINSAYRIDTLPETNITALTNRFSYVGIPIELAFAFRKEQLWRPYLKVGVFSGLLIANREYYRQSDVNGRLDLSSDMDFVPLQFGATGAFGMEGDFYKEYSILIELRYRQAITPIAEGDLSRRFYNAGIQIGILKRF